jgi:F-type H+-transporting ATPase subunit b
MFLILLLSEAVEEGGIPWWMNYPGLELWKFVNLAVFMGFGIYLLRRPLSDALFARREQIKRELAQARAERDAALKKLAEVEGRLANLDAAVSEIEERAREEASAERERILRATQTELGRLRDDVRRDIELAGKAARQGLRVFAAEESVRMAEELIRREIRTEDDIRLVSRNVEELGRVAS